MTLLSFLFTDRRQPVALRFKDKELLLSRYKISCLHSIQTMNLPVYTRIVRVFVSFALSSSASAHSSFSGLHAAASPFSGLFPFPSSPVSGNPGGKYLAVFIPHSVKRRKYIHPFDIPPLAIGHNASR
jgi:hypothetical protein